MELNKRQTDILEIVKGNGPITGEQIAVRLNLARATIRPDLAILTMAGFLDARPRVGYFYSGKKPAKSIYDSMNAMKVGDFQSIPVVVTRNFLFMMQFAICFLKMLAHYLLWINLHYYRSSFKKRFT